ncbi:nucleotidyltransferase domain-containing protein [Acidobacteria bacterium AH-259-G07]|nr:nucleotidyltransferase domain-containing protein [Acidobacteria bacterium AH-259-G07]
MLALSPHMSETLVETFRKLSEVYAETLQAALAERLISVVLFGSVARGEATPFSDIDLLVVAEGLPRGRFARRRLLQKADDAVEEELWALREQGAAVDVCVIIQTPQEAKIIRPFYLDFVEDAVILYDRRGFFNQVLAELKRSLKRLGARRLHMGNVRYWDLKPDLTPGEIFEL